MDAHTHTLTNTHAEYTQHTHILTHTHTHTYTNTHTHTHILTYLLLLASWFIVQQSKNFIIVNFSDTINVIKCSNLHDDTTH